MINFENVESLTEWTAVGVRIQARSKDHRLTDSAFDRGGQCVFCKPGSRGDKYSHPAPRRAFFGLTRDHLRVFSEDAQSKWVGKDAPAFQNLMRGAMGGCRERRPARLSNLHRELRRSETIVTPERRSIRRARLAVTYRTS